MHWTGRVAAWGAVAAVFALLSALCLTRIVDTDVWWHLASGDMILRTWMVPHSDPFSYTSPGHPWTDIHWLFQVVIAGLYGAGGIGALSILRLCVILGLFATLYRRGRGSAGTATTAAVLALAGLACQERFLIRPEIVSWALMAAVLAQLDGMLAPGEPAASSARPARERWPAALWRRSVPWRRPAPWIVLAGLQLIWVNVQGLFILGPVLAALAIAAAAGERLLMQRRSGVTPRADFGGLLESLAAMLAACLLNPFGWKAFLVPYEQFFQRLGAGTLLGRSIAEFQPALAAGIRTPATAAFVALAALTLGVLLIRLDRARLFDLLVATATFYLALRARRNLPLFAIAAVPILLRHLGPLVAGWRAVPAAWRPALAATASALLTAGSLFLVADVVTDRFYLRWPTELWWGWGTIPWHFPDDAAAYVRDTAIEGNVFHSFTVGGFLMHAWDGRRPVFIDGRNDPYVDGVLEEYLGAVADPERFEATARNRGITAVLWPHMRAIEGRALLAYLAGGHGWTLAYLDPAAAVYVRGTAAASPFLPGRDRREVYDALLRRLRERPFSGPPVREIAVAEFFSASGDPRGAGFFYRQAIVRMPGNAPLLHDYAAALERQGTLDEARAVHERALQADPAFLPSISALGVLLLQAGRADEAEARIEEAYRRGDRSTPLLIARARLSEGRGDLRAAVASFQQALLAAPGDARLLRAVAQFYERHAESEAAAQMYGLAAAAAPADAAIALERAELLIKMGRSDEALDGLRDPAGRAAARLATTGGWIEDAADVEGAGRILALYGRLRGPRR